MRVLRVGMALLLWLPACSHPSAIRANVEFGAKPPDLATITVRLKNQDSRATGELLIDVSVQLRRGENWGKAASVIHTPATILKRQEELILRSTVKLRGEGVRATVTVKESGSGRVLVSQAFEEALPSATT